MGPVRPPRFNVQVVVINGVIEVWGPRGAFVIRAEPEGSPFSPAWGPRDIPRRLVGLVKFIVGPRRWVVVVRTRAEDPTGPPVREERFGARVGARRRMIELEREYQR
jgi:hypothetical protein